MKISTNGAEFIAKWEGFREDWYLDLGDYGNWTIGFGYMNNNKELPEGFSAPLTYDEGVRLLMYCLPVYENIVNDRFPGKTFNQNQFDALVSFAYNLGKINDSLYEAIINNYDKESLKSVFEMYCHMGGEVIQGLLDRRREEWELYTTAMEITPMTKDEAKAIVKEKAGLTDATIQFIADDYRWGDDLIVKLANAMK